MPRSPELERAEQDVTSAHQEAEEARQEAAALAERVRDGDPHVTAQQLAAQRQVAEFAELRVTAAERKHAAEIAADRDRRAQASADAARKLFADDDLRPLLDAVTAARGALEQLVTLTRARTAALRAVAVDVVGLNEEMKQAGATDAWPIRPYGVLAQEYPASVTVLGSGRVEAVSAGELVAAVALLALGGDAGDRHSLMNMLRGHADARVNNLGAAVPGLADAWRATPQEWAQADGTGRTRISDQGRRPLPEQG